MTTGARCTVWWAPAHAAHPSLTRLLDATELQRHARFRRPADARRHLVGAALSRLLAGVDLDRDPARVVVDRTCHRCCETHGRPTIDGFHHSVSHSGPWVVVAIAPHARVGVDVESLVAHSTVERLAHRVLTETEQERLQQTPASEGPMWFTTTWTRKEALVKACGDGIAVPFSSIQVSDPTDLGHVEHWNGRFATDAPIWLADLTAPTTHRGAVAVLDSSPLELEELDAASLLDHAAARLEAGSGVDADRVRTWVETAPSRGH